VISQTPYKDSHTASGYGRRYNRNYAAGYYAAVYREIETPLLQKIFASLSETRSSLLDFACGTGRITRIAAPYFSRVVGVDISKEMLDCARPVGAEEFMLRDIIAKPLKESFEVVTAFRFFLNAEPDLRRQALDAIRKHLAPNGRLVCNIHMNSSSPMGYAYRLTRRLKLPTHNTLSLAEFKRTLAESGFTVEQVHWYSVLPRPGHFLGGVLDRIVGPAERLFVRAGLRGRLAQSFLIVARLADPEQTLSRSS
jgi:SAM-dependent methyltransferase